MREKCGMTQTIMWVKRGITPRWEWNRKWCAICPFSSVPQRQQKYPSILKILSPRPQWNTSLCTIRRANNKQLGGLRRGGWKTATIWQFSRSSKKKKGDENSLRAHSCVNMCGWIVPSRHGHPYACVHKQTRSRQPALWPGWQKQVRVGSRADCHHRETAAPGSNLTACLIATSDSMTSPICMGERKRNLHKAKLKKLKRHSVLEEDITQRL